MENYTIILIILGVMLGLSALAEKIKLPYPVLLIVAGIAIGFIPSMPEITIRPDVTFLIFLPPLLFEAAFNISQAEFKTNNNTIITLATGLVFLTTLGIAVVARYCIPGMSWPVSFVLGAILSATDAVAAVSITKGLNLPHKTITILEGESLINDASALVAYHFAVAAVTGIVFVWWKAGLRFVLLMAGGFLVGFIAGKLLAFIVTRTHKNATVTNSFVLLAPFVTYEVAEYFQVSGVIAVVVLGIGISRFSRQIFPEPIKQQASALWNIILFLLNGLIFILIGLELPYVVKHFAAGEMWAYIGYAFLITVATLLIRMARIFLQKFNLQHAFRKNKGSVAAAALLDFKTCIIISWSGMRGIVSLAIAIGLPEVMDNGEHFPQRNAVVFISIIVVLFTLIGQGLTLPLIVKLLRKKT
jgi:CPA1 family monovalent cation:H+ antiporter